MTVCIAAICQDGTALVLAADRMITSGTGNETEFEIPGLSKEAPKAPVLKLVPLNQHIIAMTAGNACFQAAAMQYLFTQVKDTRIDDGRVFSSIQVRDVATAYVDFCNEQRRIATDVFLSPYGLNTTSYIDKQKSLSDRFVVSITDEVESIRDRIGDPVLFCGIDEGGAHIFHSEGSTVSSCDPFAFAAIGSGGEHAESQFMLGGHTRLASLTDTITLTYVAKKRSEVAPGVGEQTDMFILSMMNPGRYYVMAHQIEKLDAVYRKMEAAQRKSLVRAQKEIWAFAKKEDVAAQQQPPSITPPPLTPDPAGQ